MAAMQDPEVMAALSARKKPPVSLTTVDGNCARGFSAAYSMVEKTISASSDGSACAAERLENGHGQRIVNGQMIAWSPFIR